MQFADYFPPDSIYADKQGSASASKNITEKYSYPL
jgi:hypothetical protein